MKTIIAALICVLLLSCQHKENNSEDNYLRVHTALTKDGVFMEFVGYQIIPREKNYYVVILSKPEVTLYLTYSGDKKIDVNVEGINALKDSLSKYNMGNVDKEKGKIFDEIGNLISFMKQESIESVSYMPVFSDNINNYFIDFRLSSNETLRYDCLRKNENKIYPNNIIVATWIDTSWVYLKSKPPEGTK